MKLSITTFIGLVLIAGFFIVSRSNTAPGGVRTGTTDELLANLISEVAELRQRVSQLERQVATLAIEGIRAQKDNKLDKDNVGLHTNLDTVVGSQGDWPDADTLRDSIERHEGARRAIRLRNVSGYDVDEHGLLIDHNGRPVGLWGVDQGYRPSEGAVRR